MKRTSAASARAVEGQPGNSVPVAISQSVEVAETVSTSYPVPLTGTDADGDPVFVIIVDGPSHGLLLTGQGENGDLNYYTPNTAYNGPDAITFLLDDGKDRSEIATLSITVTPVDLAPLPTSGSYTVSWGSSIPISLPGFYYDTPNPVVSLTSQPRHGTLTGTLPNLVYTPDPGFSIQDDFNTSTTDGNSTVAGNVSIKIIDVPQPILTAEPQTLTTPMGQSLEITLKGFDPSGRSLNYFVDPLPAHGTITSGLGSVRTYTPDVGFVGDDSFYFRVTNSSQASPRTLVTISVTGPAQPTNRAPVATPQSLTATSGMARPVTLAATDADGDPLTYTAGQPSHGTLTGSGTDYVYTPSATWVGADSFTFTAFDGTVTSAPATVGFTVTKPVVNRAPTACSKTLKTTAATPVQIRLSGSDPEGKALTYSYAQPTNGTVSGTGRDVTYTPRAGFSGTDRFTFTVNDGTSSSKSATVTITVKPANRAPVATGQTLQIRSCATVIQLTGTDPDGDSLSYTVSRASHGTVRISGRTTTYTPDKGYKGADSFTFTVNDGRLTSTAKISLTIR